ncbi:MAG TPA: class I SAM-dependent methyltransferase [Candidatus Dormibacteraeota bacterium]|nr:class I SAM-dependent methyltransferase [Candidatus Dormibacteraeota bacterium]
MNDRRRYDGLADWYDQEVRHSAGADVTATALQSLTGLLGSGPGKCLDVGCGTGIAIPDLAKLGWTVVGVDISADQLRVAREQTAGLAADLLEADASHLPFPTGSFDAVVSMLTHTDFDDPAGAFAEVYRVLRPGGKFVYVGTHPCFVTPYVERKPGGDHVLHPGYRRRGWTSAGPGFGHGIRPRVGVNHQTLADFLQAILETGLTLKAIEEPGAEDYPILLSVAAERPLNL